MKQSHLQAVTLGEQMPRGHIKKRDLATVLECNGASHYRLQTVDVVCSAWGVQQHRSGLPAETTQGRHGQDLLAQDDALEQTQMKGVAELGLEDGILVPMKGLRVHLQLHRLHHCQLQGSLWNSGNCLFYLLRDAPAVLECTL
jgi:hypothetical protein